MCQPCGVGSLLRRNENSSTDDLRVQWTYSMIQCRALASNKRRCPEMTADDSPYCVEHRAEMERLWGRAADAPSTRLGGWFAKLRNPAQPSIPDGAKYEVPGWLKDAPTEQVIEHLQTHSDAMVRWMAAFVLRKRRAVAAIDPLWRVLQSDPVRYVRQQSAVALGKIGAPTVYMPLVEALHHDRDPGVREACVIALGNLGYRMAADEIAQALEREENVFCKWDCIIALGELGDRRCETLLLRMQDKEIAQVLRDACRDALTEIHRRERAMV